MKDLAVMEKQKIGLIKSVLKKNEHILAAYLFGSQIKTNPNKYSDIDIAILFDNKIKEEDYTNNQIVIMNNLGEILDKEIDIIIFNRASLFLKFHILKEGIKIYEKQNRNEHSFEALAIMQYLDFLPIKNRIENGLLSKIKGA